ncbi:TPA: molybdopterin-dependent oxidoreductase FAD-binding subunit [Escherichia coli]|nr:molybdopterin-dependent oxidoreductase FAD-binding subunit [Escherichia coli]EFK5045845.1 molybdopterin-dependent oxidoreductase FAD-binding subunit [Escherichia coli]HAW8564731.1 molybdopterin-dependent oxidoreductase FAD-binding subunit [Escherichia coli]
MLILKNVTAVQLHPAKVQEGVDIAIENDVIVAIGDALTQRYPDASYKEMHGRIVMPGIVCSHNHFYSGLSRGIMANIAPCPDFISTLKNLWWRLDRALDEESLYYSGLICSLEAIKSGCTSVIDHHASPAYIGGSLSTLRDAFLKVGLRAMTCFETTDRNNGIKELQEGVEENIRFARQIDEAKKAATEPYLVEAHIGAHAPFTVPDAGLEMLREAVKATGRGLHIHAAEDLYDVSYSHHWYGKDLLALDAELVFGNGETLSIEDYLACPCDRLLTEIIIKDPYRTCATRKISRSQAGLTVVTAAVAITDHDGMRIALDGVASKALRLHDVEKQNLEGNALEQAVANDIFPQEDLRGSVAYKRYITGVLVADLYADCQQAGEEAV